MKPPLPPTPQDAMLAALRQDDAVALGHLLAQGVTVSDRFHFQRTPLHYAAEYGATRSVTLLLEKKADLEARDEAGSTPLVTAIGYQHPETATVLLQAGARLHYTHTPEDTPEKQAEARRFHQQISAGARREHPEFFELIAQGLEPGEEAQFERELADLFVQTLVAPHEVHAINFCSDLATLRLLVEEYGADVNVEDRTGSWPLWVFAERGDATAVAWLLKHGARPDFNTTGATALHAAVAGDHLACARLLLEAGANPNQPDVDGCVALWRVASHAMLDLLLGFGADPTLGDQCGFKPSHWIKDAGIKARLLALEKAARRRGKKRPRIPR
jgi:ankyrin repeat protein